MARLELPILPPFLYRYRAISQGRLEQELLSITDRYLWCSVYPSLNDPMEGFYQPSTRFRKQTLFTKAVQKIFAAKQAVGVCALSDTFDNELMWTHYTDNYSGICISYRPRLLLDTLPDDVRLTRLGYGGVPPEVGIHDGESPENAARKILAHKKANWIYEREWRVFARPGAVHFTGDCVAEVRLGLRIAASHRDQILQRLDGCKVRIYQMRVEGYDHDWELISKKT